jgi:hypothetical protein
MAGRYLILILFSFPLVAFVLGLSRVPTWSCVVCSLFKVTAWGVLRLTKSRDYDMRHALLWFRLILSVASFVAWFGGRAISVWVRWVNRK